MKNKHRSVSKATNAAQDGAEDHTAALRALPDIVYKIDTKGRFTFINKSVSILGYEPKELIGKHFSKIVHPADVRAFSRHYVLPKFKNKTTGDANAPKLFDERRTRERKTKNLEIRLMPKNWRKIRESETIFGMVTALGDVSASGFYGSDLFNGHAKFLGTLGIIRDITDRKKAEDKLHYQADMIGNVTDAIISTNLNFNIRTWNTAAEKMYGWQIHEIIDRSLHKVTTSEYPYETKRGLVEKLFKNGYWKGEVIQKRKDKASIYVLSSMSLVKDSFGKSIGIVAVNHDITSRKKNEQVQTVLYEISKAVSTGISLNELFELIHKQLSTILDTTNFYIALYNKNNKTISFPYFVDEKKRFVQIPIGRSFTSHVIKNSKPLLVTKEVRERLRRKGEAIEYGVPAKIWLGVPLMIKKNTFGALVVQSYSNAVHYSKDDMKVLQFVSNQVAIAIDRMRADEAIRESESKFRDLVENINDVIYSVDAQAIITYMSPTIKNIAGSEPSEVVGKSFFNYVFKDDLQMVKQRFKDVLKGKREPAEYRIVTKSGTTRWIRSSSRIVFKKGKTISIHGVFIDVTERKLMEQRLGDALQKLRGERQKLVELTRRTIDAQERERLYLASEIHDELLQGIVAIKYFLQMIDVSLLDKETQETKEKLIETIKVSIDKGRALISEIGPIREPITGLIQAIKKSVDLRFVASDVEISSRYPKKLPDVGLAMKANILRIVQEALMNVHKHAKATKLSIRMSYSKDMLTIIIKDNGVGFNSELIMKNKKDHYGLLVMHERAKLVGGNIAAISKPGHGTILKAVFPLDGITRYF